MIFIMAVIGAITRLTESGLSITEWKPITGAIPPLDAADWDHAFALYRQSPQYRAINQGMTLDEFRNIFFWEWLHRLWGRLIGLAYALPLAFFWFRGMIPPGFKKPLLIGLLLGGLQGFIGWFMVQSGLQEGMASVSAVRLAVHLGLALFIYGFLFWQALRLTSLNAPSAAFNSFCMRRHAFITLLFISLALVWGALTAGLDAGKIYNSFPLMDGHILPPDALAMQPPWLNFFHNPAAVQFMHRLLAIAAYLILVFLAARFYRNGAQRTGAALALLATAQVGLGVATLLSGAWITLAVLHQANAVLVLSACVTALYLAMTPRRS